MLQLKDISIETKQGRNILSHVSLTIQKGDKIAIIGEEGNGKSTLLKAIYHKEEIPYVKITGEILKENSKIGYLEQFMKEEWKEQTVEEYLLKKEPKGEIQYEKYESLFSLEKLFRQLELPYPYFEQEQKVGNLSGGEKVKLQLCKLLWEKPDILLLDEPTNDLDIDTLEYLENFIRESDKAIVYISHDEVLLEKTAKAILHIEQIDNKTDSRITFERIGYREYSEKRQHWIEKQTQIAQNEKREKEKEEERFQKLFQSVEYQQETITRQNPSGGRLLKKKMKTLKAQQKKMEEKEITQKPYVEEAILAKFHQDEGIASKKVVVDVFLKELVIGEKILKENVTLKVVGEEKVVIVGKNGSGKTTFLRKIYESMKERNDISVGYMPQEYEEEIPKQTSVLDFLKKEGTREEETLARTYLGSMKFTKEEMLGRVENLSGGQKAKLFLVKLMLDKNNVLLLDEPTRNLSPLTNPILRELLKNFKGAIICVSHDRKLIEEVATRIITL